jgi:hypothetical protein
MGKRAASAHRKLNLRHGRASMPRGREHRGRRGVQSKLLTFIPKHASVPALPSTEGAVVHTGHEGGGRGGPAASTRWWTTQATGPCRRSSAFGRARERPDEAEGVPKPTASVNTSRGAAARPLGVSLGCEEPYLQAPPQGDLQGRDSPRGRRCVVGPVGRLLERSRCKEPCEGAGRPAP